MTAEQKAAKAAEAETKAAEVKDPKSEYVNIYIPKTDKDDTQRLISVNFVDYMVQTNKNVLVPPEVAEVYFNSIAEEEYRDAKDAEAQVD